MPNAWGLESGFVNSVRPPTFSLENTAGLLTTGSAGGAKAAAALCFMCRLIGDIHPPWLAISSAAIPFCNTFRRLFEPRPATLFPLKPPSASVSSSSARHNTKPNLALQDMGFERSTDEKVTTTRTRLGCLGSFEYRHEVLGFYSRHAKQKLQS